jgi:hypothetical protein
MRDRLPFGSTGVAALAVGLDYTGRMFSTMSLRVDIKGGGEPISAVEELRAYLLSSGLDRDRLLAAKQDLHYTLAVAHGYAHADVTNHEDLASASAFTSFAAKHRTGQGVGKELYNALVLVEADPAALASVVGGLLTGVRTAIVNLTTALEGTKKLPKFEDPTGATKRPTVFKAIAAEDIMVGLTADQRREQNKEMELRIRAAEAGLMGPAAVKPPAVTAGGGAAGKDVPAILPPGGAGSP